MKPYCIVHFTMSNFHLNDICLSSDNYNNLLVISRSPYLKIIMFGSDYIGNSRAR